ncbi:hypothetical protein EPD60_15175 [Flaviaesturariibacter flavus]|uniref:Circularly permuted type 2 ATP-grasp protein n=1 Tax=Flaviaesturariibacter flavus TaxID=2502780 RepID=A0A4R1B7N6_9BACT|nr:hypothetical protein [Flaviaesturariibacter flavus]TCJ12608.1 hypothetical protein EPD60_15175 [Flaviaesturariibacter flavus]
MIPALRKAYNEAFTEEKYRAFVEDLSNTHPGQLDFRVAETPIFVPKDFRDKMLSACESIVDAVLQPEYIRQSEAAIPPQLRVPNEDGHPQFIAFDFGICAGADGVLEPQLIEMQGFPSLFAYQVLFPEVHRRHFGAPEGFSPYLNGFNKETYLAFLKKLIIGDETPENVVLLEIFPEQQKTRIDFAATKSFIGIETVCLTQLIREGRKLYYEKAGRRIPINRIYNRLIFDDLHQQPADVQEVGKLFQEDLDVTWVPHPNWFYRLSKYTLPFIDHPYVPKTKFLSDVATLPADLENYVVKPLFSFAGQGVIIDVTPEAVAAIRDPENWILQRKVPYAPAILTPDEPAKAEIRIFYFWEPGTPRPIATNNLARLSKGKMVGVRYNKDKEWVGGTFCLFEE